MHEERVEAILSEFFSGLDGRIEDIIASEFKNSDIQNLTPSEIAKGLRNYFQKEAKFSGVLFAKQTLLEEQFKTILQQFQLLSQTASSISDLKQSLDQLKIQYNASIDSIKVSIDSVKNSADILSSSVTRIDQSIGRLATNDGVKALLSDEGKSWVSKQDLEEKFSGLTTELNGTKSELEAKFQEVKSAAWLQFGVLIAGLFIGFLGVITTIFVTVYPLLQNSQRSNDAGVIQHPPTSQPKPSP